MAEETKTDVAATEEPAKDAKKARSGKKKWPIVVGVVAVVLVAAGAGFFVWHEQPSFCNAICHTPMDAYAESYIDGSHDKYGNELTEESDKMAMMAYYHGHTTEGETTNCLGCHVPTLGEQITEGMHWVTGSLRLLARTRLVRPSLKSASWLTSSRLAASKRMSSASTATATMSPTTARKSLLVPTWRLQPQISIPLTTRILPSTANMHAASATRRTASL